MSEVLRKKLYEIMKDEKKRTLEFLATTLGEPPKDVLREIRNLRKPQYGGHIVECLRIQKRPDTKYEYQLTKPMEQNYD